MYGRSVPSFCWYGYARSTASGCGTGIANDVSARPCCGETSSDRDYDHGARGSGNVYDRAIASDDGHGNGSGCGDASVNACGDHGTGTAWNGIATVCFATENASSGIVWNGTENVSNDYGNVYAIANASSVTWNASGTGTGSDDPWNGNANATGDGWNSYPWPASR